MPIEPIAWKDNPSSLPSMSGQQRLGVAMIGLVLAGLLIVARLLDPDPRGLGTHRQLGLPPCTILAWFHVRCPSCGMTTAWAHVVRGHLLQACQSNAGGTLLAVSAVVALPWLIGSALRGGWMYVRPADWGVLTYCLCALLVTITDWLFRIAF